MIENYTTRDLLRIIQFQQEIIAYNGELSTLMSLICQKCMDLTHSIGSVIEIVDENYMVYHVASGTLKDYVGLRLNIDKSLSGLSAKTREIKISNDALNDPLVDREAAKKVKAHSMICVPFAYKEKVLGVLKVISDKVNFFSEREIDILKLLSSALSSKMYQIQEAVELANVNQKLTEQAAISRSRLEARTRFLANISHEIRTPLTGIIGTIDLLKDTELNEKQKTYLDALDSSADTLISLINDILDFSKIEAGQVKLEQITINLKDTAESAVNNMIFRAKKKQIELNLNYDERIPPYLLGDPIRIQEILLNLISNSIKFTSKGKVDVTLKLHSLDKEFAIVKFIVSDTGIGIPKKLQKEIFKPFEQADKSTTRKYGGTGLGLSITKNLVEMMNGKIFLKSKVGEGTTFWFKLKLPITSPNETSSANSQSKTISGLNVLVAEDNIINAMITQQMLEKLGHKSVWVENGVEALKAIVNSEFDLVLMDCYMPEMDGFEATRKIRSSPNKKVAEVPIFALTASVFTPEDKKWKEAGMNHFLSKPIRLQKLAEALDSITKSYEMESQ